MPAFVVDGNDPVVVAAVVADAHDRARRGDGPTFLECKTVRLYGHYNGDVEHYRSKENKRRRRTPPILIGRLRGRLLVDGEMSLGELEDLERAVAEEARQCDGRTRSTPPSPTRRPRRRTSSVPRGCSRVELAPAAARRAELTYSQAVNAALRRELEERSDVFVFGEDVGAYRAASSESRGGCSTEVRRAPRVRHADLRERDPGLGCRARRSKGCDRSPRSCGPTFCWSRSINSSTRPPTSAT